MSHDHPEWTDLLSGYLDGELDPVTRRRLESHLEACPGCSGVLRDLRRIVAAAPGYRGTEPSEAVWTGIASAIDRGRALPFARPAAALRRYPLRHLVAAGLVMALAGAGATWALLGGPAGGAPVVELASERLPEVVPVSAGAARYDAAVAELEATLAAGRDQLDSATVRVLEASLTTIDRAIAEARAAIQRDSGNAYLNGQIAANLRKKVNLLRLATRALASET